MNKEHKKPNAESSCNQYANWRCSSVAENIRYINTDLEKGKEKTQTLVKFYISHFLSLITLKS